MFSYPTLLNPAASIMPANVSCVVVHTWLGWYGAFKCNSYVGVSRHFKLIIQ